MGACKVRCPECGAELTVSIEQEEETCQEAEGEKEQEKLAEEEWLIPPYLKRGVIAIMVVLAALVLLCFRLGDVPPDERYMEVNVVIVTVLVVAFVLAE